MNWALGRCKQRNGAVGEVRLKKRVGELAVKRKRRQVLKSDGMGRKQQLAPPRVTLPDRRYFM
ncbi:hypothetical protein KIN20_023681 [Parelaphostrongylus tenuis]|uniref:Uncharacterized protein n=1 Tax=Parelaphostrongylus tenuis TaxID=148309 RepID=A0AAD5MSE6_PARTN|nr:hypothetical protein KIN20_023681 [Parelaphostrongylus tenuis]